MPWKTSNLMSLRNELVTLAHAGSVSVTELCRRFEVSRKTAYKWLARAEEAGVSGLSDRSRRPLNSPRRSEGAIVEQAIALRQAHPAWGARKIAASLKRQQVEGVPATSTIHHILRRAGLVGDSPPGHGKPYQRFEHAAPNDLWQVDFKGDFAVGDERCHPLTAVDDHSRFNLILHACSAKKSTDIVQPLMESAFRRYGLPIRINVDNGPPWGSPRAPRQSLSALTIWWIRLGICVSFSTPGHPQTNGKGERFHRSLKAEVLNGRTFTDLPRVQAHLDRWRDTYNQVRPHEGIGMAVPADRYHASPRPYPTTLPAIEYAPDDHLVKVGKDGICRFKNVLVTLPASLNGYCVALRPTAGQDGVYDVYFSHHRLRTIDLRDTGS